MLTRLVSLITLLSTVTARIHNISIDSDRREIIPLSSFGLFKEGFINLDVTKIKAEDWKFADYGEPKLIIFKRVEDCLKIYTVYLHTYNTDLCVRSTKSSIELSLKVKQSLLGNTI